MDDEEEEEIIEPFPWLDLLPELRGVIRDFLPPPERVWLQRTCTLEGWKENKGVLLPTEFITTRFNKGHLLLRQWYWQILREFWANGLLEHWPEVFRGWFNYGFENECTTIDTYFKPRCYRYFWDLTWALPEQKEPELDHLLFHLKVGVKMDSIKSFPPDLETRIKNSCLLWNLCVTNPGDNRYVGMRVYHKQLRRLIHSTRGLYKWISPRFLEGFRRVFST